MAHVQIKQQEIAARKSVIANPVQMDAVKRQAEAVAAEKAARKQAKKDAKAAKKAKKQVWKWELACMFKAFICPLTNAAVLMRSHRPDFDSIMLLETQQNPCSCTMLRDGHAQIILQHMRNRCMPQQSIRGFTSILNCSSLMHAVCCLAGSKGQAGACER